MLGKETGQDVLWPSSGTAIVKFTFGKFKEVGGFGNQKTYVIDTTAQNLGAKTISNATFALYLFDKNKIRIGEGLLSLANVGAGETIKFATDVSTPGNPVTLAVVAKYLPPELQAGAPPKAISITVNSVPQEARLKVDGVEVGMTPKMVQVGPGKHLLEFAKEGFSGGRFPLEIGPNDLSGASVSYELGTSSHDSIELRDGSVLTGDLETMSATEVAIKVGGSLQRLDRNQVKRIVLTQRDPPQ